MPSMPFIGKGNAELIFSYLKKGFNFKNPYILTRPKADVVEHFLPITGTKVLKGNAKDGTKFFTVNFGDGNKKMGKVGGITFYTNENGEKVADIATKNLSIWERNIPLKYLKEAIRDMNKTVS